MTARKPGEGIPPLGIDWRPRELPAGTTTRNVVLRTGDGADTFGTLYAAGAARKVVTFMHPRELFLCHYLIPDVLAAGCAAWAQAGRSAGSDLRLEHETALHDVAAGMSFLRKEGFETIVALGNSGGTGLYALYIQQSSLEPAARLAQTPGGRPTKLAGLEMPAVDGCILIAPHPGQGLVLMDCIDPSVSDENMPLSVDPTLDAFDPGNGFSDPPTASRYSAQFMTRYREAQVARVARIDIRARTLIQERIAARTRLRQRPDRLDRRVAAHTQIMVTWRTDADIRCLDLSIDPSERNYGSVWGTDMLASNYGSLGFGRLCSPEAWLSTWSGLSSNALFHRTMPSIKVPTLMIEYTGDTTCFPARFKEIFSAIGTADKRHLRVRGDHYGRPLAPGEEPGRYMAGRAIRDWLAGQFMQ